MSIPQRSGKEKEKKEIGKKKNETEETKLNIGRENAPPRSVCLKSIKIRFDLSIEFSVNNRMARRCMRLFFLFSFLINCCVHVCKTMWRLRQKKQVNFDVHGLPFSQTSLKEERKESEGVLFSYSHERLLSCVRVDMDGKSFFSLPAQTGCDNEERKRGKKISITMQGHHFLLHLLSLIEYAMQR